MAELVGAPFLRQEARDLLADVLDVERLTAKVSTLRAHARDLIGLCCSLEVVTPLRAKLESSFSRLLGTCRDDLDPLDDLVSRIRNTLVDDPPLTLKEGGLVKSGVSSQLDELRSIAGDGKSWMARFQSEEMLRTGMPGLKVGFNSVFGYFLEVPRGQVDRVPAHYIRKQTVKNAERYITPELKEFETKVLKAEERSRDLEYELFTALRDEVAKELGRILDTAHAFPANAPVDLHLIGHSEGAVVNSRAILQLNQTGGWTTNLKAGYLKVTMLENWLFALSRTGRWDEAERLAEEALAQTAAHGIGLVLHNALAEIAVARGDDVSCDHHLARAATLVATLDPATVHDGAVIRAERALWRGDPAAAGAEVMAALAVVADRDQRELVVDLCRFGLWALADGTRRSSARKGADENRLARADDFRDVAEAAGRRDETSSLAATTATCLAEHARVRREDTADA